MNNEEISELKDAIDLTTPVLVVLSFVTFGIFQLMYIYANTFKIELVTEETVSGKYFSAIAAVFFAIYINSLSEINFNEDVLLIASVAYLVYAAMLIVWSFNAKKALETHYIKYYQIDIRMNSFYTFFFNVFYINFCINDIPDKLIKQKMMQDFKMQSAEHK